MATRSIITMDTLQNRLREYEDKYGVPSEDLDMAFRASPLRETDDFHDWSLLYAAYLSGLQRKRV